MNNQNFKKRVAVLLAGTMALSAAPVNVFNAFAPTEVQAFDATVRAATPGHGGRPAHGITERDADNFQFAFNNIVGLNATSVNTMGNHQQNNTLGFQGATPNVQPNSAFLYSGLSAVAANTAAGRVEDLIARPDMPWLTNRNGLHGDVNHIHQGRYFTVNINEHFRTGVQATNEAVSLSYHINLSNAQWHVQAFDTLRTGQHTALFGGVMNNDLFFNQIPDFNGFIGNTFVGNATQTNGRDNIIGGFTNQGLVWSLIVHSNTSATLTIHDVQELPNNGAMNNNTIPLYTLLRTTGSSDAASMTVTPINTQGFHWNMGGNNNQTLPLTTPATEGVAVSFHGQTTHRNRLTAHLRLTEQIQGQFHNANAGVIELVAPTGFTWATPDVLARSFRNADNTADTNFETLRSQMPSIGFSRPLSNNTVLRVHIGDAAQDVPANARAFSGANGTVINPLVSEHGFTIAGGFIQLNNLLLHYNGDHTGAPRNVEVTVQNAQFRSVANDLRGNSGTVAGTNQVVATFVDAATAAGQDVLLSATVPGLPATVTVRDITTTPATVLGSVVIPAVPFGGDSLVVAVANQNIEVSNRGTAAIVGGLWSLSNPIWRFDARPQVINNSASIAWGTLADWAVTLDTVSDDIPQLISGRFDAQNMGSVESETHRAARVRVSEVVAQSWHEERGLNLYLPEGVTVRQANFLRVENIQNGAVLSGPTFYNLGMANRQNENVVINGNVITVTGLTRNNVNNRVEFDLDLDLSISADFEGDIYLSLGGRGIGNDNDTPYVVIAEAIAPISVVAGTPTNIRLGYQFLPVGNFSIVENLPGALLVDREVFITITDQVFSELAVAPGFNWAVTEGDIAITQMRSPINVTGFMQGQAVPHIVFEVAGASTEASTIEFSNLQVRQVMVSPISNHGYDVLVWGPAVTQNFNHTLVQEALEGNIAGLAQTGSNLSTANFLNMPQGTRLERVNPRDLFHVAGHSAPFITIGTAGAAVTNQVITMSSDGAVTVGGAAYTIPAEFGTAGVNANGVLTIPARLAFSLFFDTANPYDPDLFVWNAATSTFHIDPAGRNISFTTNSSVMTVGGVQRQVVTGEGANAVATSSYVNAQTGRLMIPARAFADALGLNVDWDPASSTATFSPRG